METTLLSATNSSNCSRREEGICALTVASRFSLRMVRKTGAGDEQPAPGKPTATGGEPIAVVGGSHRNVGLTALLIQTKSQINAHWRVSTSALLASATGRRLYHPLRLYARAGGQIPTRLFLL